MNLGDVLDELNARLATIDGLRVLTAENNTVHAPAALVTLPEAVNFHSTYGVGTTTIDDLVVMVLIANPGERQAMTQVMPYVNEVGAQSIKACLEAPSPVPASFDVITVKSVEFETVEISEVPYLAALFHCHLVGTGAA